MDIIVYCIFKYMQNITEYCILNIENMFLRKLNKCLKQILAMPRLRLESKDLGREEFEIVAFQTLALLEELAAAIKLEAT